MTLLWLEYQQNIPCRYFIIKSDITGLILQLTWCVQVVIHGVE